MTELRIDRESFSWNLEVLSFEDTTMAGIYAYLALCEDVNKPLSAREVADRRDMDLEHVQSILKELYRRQFISRTSTDSAFVEYYVGSLDDFKGENE